MCEMYNGFVDFLTLKLEYMHELELTNRYGFLLWIRCFEECSGCLCN